MKTLLFSLLFIGGILPNIAFGQTVSPQTVVTPKIPEGVTVVKSYVVPGTKTLKTEYSDGSILTIMSNEPNPPIVTYLPADGSRNNVNPKTGEVTQTVPPTQTNLQPNNQNDVEQQKTPTNVPLLNQIAPSDNFKEGKFSDQPLSLLLNQLFWIGLVGAVILALVMIIRGGIEYMTIDSISGKENGKNRIRAALGGLILAFSAILILNTINPNLTKLSIVFPELKRIDKTQVTGAITSGIRPETYSSINNAITPTSDGYTITPGRVAIDTDGTQPPPFNDPDYRGQTSMMGLNANTDNYVVVPLGSTIPLGTKVKMYNEDTGLTAWGIVGDRGPSPNGFGEISLHAAKDLGAWTDGMGNSAKNHKITYTYYTNN